MFGNITYHLNRWKRSLIASSWFERGRSTTDGQGVGNEYELWPLNAVLVLLYMVCADKMIEFVSNSNGHKFPITIKVGSDVPDTWEN